MFKLTDRFWWPVDLEVPGDGQVAKHRIEVQFARRTQAQLDALATSNKTDADICREVVVGWKGVLADNGQEVPFTAQNLEQLLEEIAGARLTIASTYFDAMQGAARRKNFNALRGIGS